MPRRMSPAELEAGYARAYREFYRWSSIARGAAAHAELAQRVRHFCYSASWKKFEGVWNAVIRARQLALARPMLEALLAARPRRVSLTPLRPERMLTVVPSSQNGE